MVRRDLEGLRAIAVLGVVVYHLHPSWLPGGFAGVDVFFVLSGYFITGLLLREVDRTGTVDLLRFWGRRARRLLPASALVLTVTVVGAYVLTNPLESRRVGRDGLWASVFGVNWLAARQATDYLQDPDPSPLVHYWSLGVEEQFYLAWPLLLLGCALLVRLARRLTLRRVLVTVTVPLAAASFLLALHQTQPANSYAYFGTPERMWQLALGGLAAVVAGRLARLPGWLLLVSRYLGVTLVLAFYVLASTSIVYPGRKALVPALGAVLIIAAVRAPRRDPLARLLGSAPAQLGGRYSYSWYLWHYPPLVLLPIALGRPLSALQLLLCAAATLAAAVLTYHLLENPVRSSRWLAGRRGGRSLALGAVLVLLVGCACAVTRQVAGRDVDHTQITTATGVPLDPQPSVAATTPSPPPWHNGCLRAVGTPASAAECRVLPDTGHGDVVVLGDSHAAMWWTATLDIAKAHDWGYRFWGRQSCSVADVTKSGPGGHGVYSACDRWRSNVFSRLIADHPSLVIMDSLDTSITDLVPRDAAGKPTAGLVNGAKARVMWEQGMVRSLTRLRDAGIAVLMIHDVPGYPQDMTAPDCALEHAGNLDACSLPEAQARPGPPDDLQAALAVGGVSTVDFTPVFCHSGRCYQVVGHTLAYVDYNHLTTQMTLRLEPGLGRAAVAAMRGGVRDPVHQVVTSAP